MRPLKLLHFDSEESRPPSPSIGRPSLVRRNDVADDEPTPRELEVEDLLCRGYSQENIAAIWGRSVNTISAHAMSLYKKRQVHSQVGLLLAYLERNGIFVFNDEEADRASSERLSLKVAQ
jgi:DNA-binding CsgD family transcriptional regulator